MILFFKKYIIKNTKKYGVIFLRNKIDRVLLIKYENNFSNIIDKVVASE